MSLYKKILHNLSRRKPRKKQIMKNFPIIDIHLYLQKILYHIFALCATTFSPATAAATQPTLFALLCPNLTTPPPLMKHTRTLSAHAPPSALSSPFLSYFYSLLRPFFSAIFSSQTLLNQYAAKHGLPAFACAARTAPALAGHYPLS